MTHINWSYNQILKENKF